MVKKLDFVNLKYKPRDDLVCLFRVEPVGGKTVKETANVVALESSTGTWTAVASEKDYVKRLRAKVFSIKGNKVKIAYPQELFEKDNIPNILSSVAGNIFGMKGVKNLRLEDVSFSKKMLKNFSGPKYGIKGIRKMMKVKTRPLIGTIVKPKLGLKTKDHAKCAYDCWVGGCDFVKDDENLSSQEFNPFEKRAVKTLELCDKAEEETGEKKAYLINVTGKIKDMMKRAQLVESLGGKYVMIDVITAGFAAVQHLRDAGFKMAIHGHRAMHAAMTRNQKHGISMFTLADFSRLAGIDTLHIGTAIGKLEGDEKLVKCLVEEIEHVNVRETSLRLAQNWGKIKSTMAVNSGGLHPGHIPYLVKHFGKDIVIQMGGGIHGHPQGSLAGAKAARQALEAVMKKKSLKEYSKKHKELEMALRQWA